MERVLLLGNPGTGKSTLLNSLIGRPVFQSGISLGVGHTQFLQEYHAHGVTYIDTPGLADVALRQQAAAAITAALRKHGSYKLFFVIMLRSGRVRPEDVVTINKVIESVDISPLSFSVIVNSVKPVAHRRILSDQQACTAILSSLNSGQHSTQSVCFLPLMTELEEKRNTIMRPCPPDFVAFVNRAPGVFIPLERVRNVTLNHATFEHQLAQAQSEITRLTKENDDLEARAEQLQIPQQSSHSGKGGSITKGVAVGVVAAVLCSIM